MSARRDLSDLRRASLAAGFTNQQNPYAMPIDRRQLNALGGQMPSSVAAPPFFPFPSSDTGRSHQHLLGAGAVVDAQRYLQLLQDREAEAARLPWLQNQNASISEIDEELKKRQQPPKSSR